MISGGYHPLRHAALLFSGSLKTPLEQAPFLICKVFDFQKKTLGPRNEFLKEALEKF